MPDISLFYGDEDFLIDEEIGSLKKKYSELNVERIDGSREDMGRIISALTSVPMLGGERLVVIDNLEYDDKEEGELFDAVKGKALAWIVNRVKVYGKKISGKAANMLIDIVGLGLRMLDKEIEKIATFIGERGTIEEGDVSRLASSGEADSFALSNAVRNKNVKEAMESLERLFRDNEDPHMIIGMLASLYRMLLQVKCLEMEGMNQNEIAGKLRAKPFFVRKCMERTASFSREELIKNIRLLHEADLKMKSGYSPKLTLEMLVPQLCNG